MQERERAFYYNSRYCVTEEEAFLAGNREAPFAKVCSDIDSDIYLKNYAAFRKKRVLPAMLFLAVGIVIFVYAFIGSTRWEDENRAYMTAIYACVPLAFAAGIGIKSYLKSAAFLRRIERKYEFDQSRDCELMFFSDHFTYYDRIRKWPMMIKGIEVIPCTAIVKIYSTDTFLALIDRDDRGYCMLTKDIPADVYEWIEKNCQGAKRI